jgi:hypothetical protein
MSHDELLLQRRSFKQSFEYIKARAASRPVFDPHQQIGHIPETVALQRGRDVG